MDGPNHNVSDCNLCLRNFLTRRCWRRQMPTVNRRCSPKVMFPWCSVQPVSHQYWLPWWPIISWALPASALTPIRSLRGRLTSRNGLEKSSNSFSFSLTPSVLLTCSNQMPFVKWFIRFMTKGRAGGRGPSPPMEQPQVQFSSLREAMIFKV